MKKILFTLLALSLFSSARGQQGGCDPATGVDAAGRKCGGTIQTAVPFLMINPDARSGAMGDVGIAISPDANAINFNASKYAMAESKFGVSLSYTPWLRSLGVNDIYLANLAGYSKFGSGSNQAIGVSLRYFSLGSIQWTDFNAQLLGEGSPREFEVGASYSRELSKNFAIGVTGKFIYSNLATGQTAEGSDRISSGRAGAVDFSATYKSPISMAAGKSNLMVGMAVRNIGNKITYLRSADFLPTNLGIGASWDIPFDQYNSIVIAADFNKLLVITPQRDSTDGNNNKIYDWKEVSPISGVLKSFGDAPGGGQEELKEVNYSLGVEYWYDKQFAVRAGYFHESAAKGGRQYFTVGLGLKYNVLGINLSYLVPTASQRGPLDNTLRFSLLFDAASFRDTDTESN
ncbi:MAG: type IX secretion system outer membrane channel protein PorV [Saprospiraceae bacterium]|nr:type IX secretion system outer membrane channel protein PorV [Saprospiraceae bacterium]